MDLPESPLERAKRLDRGLQEIDDLLGFERVRVAKRFLKLPSNP